VSSPEPTQYVNDARYAQLAALLQDARTRNRPGDADAGDAVARLIFHEAWLLDERRYDDWLAVFVPECLYWVPSRHEPGDPRTETGIYLDDRRRLADRVGLIRTGHLHAQIPPSRTRRMLTNIEQWRADDGALRARANVVIWEYRKGHTRANPGSQVYEIVRDASGALSIATKIVCLLDCDAPQGNYSFIL
jgi:benzoate/toluate 1,2-dioxygenase beta subunit